MLSRWLRALAAATALALVVVGVPLVLIAVAGWPFPGKVPDWDRVVRMVRQGEVPAEPVIKALAVVVWLAWAQAAWALVWELTVNVPAQVAGASRPSACSARRFSRVECGRPLVAVILAVGLFAASARSPRALLSPRPHRRAVVPRSSSIAGSHRSRNVPRRRHTHHRPRSAMDRERDRQHVGRRGDGVR
jgi:hypothetical protein